MAKKLTKALVSMALCTALAAGAIAVTSYAANDPRTCPHSYYELSDYYFKYTYMNPDQHRITGWERYYCFDCCTYSDYIMVNFTENHILPCSECGVN